MAFRLEPLRALLENWACDERLENIFIQPEGEYGQLLVSTFALSWHSSPRPGLPGGLQVQAVLPAAGHVAVDAAVRRNDGPA